MGTTIMSLLTPNLVLPIIPQAQLYLSFSTLMYDNLFRMLYEIKNQDQTFDYLENKPEKIMNFKISGYII